MVLGTRSVLDRAWCLYEIAARREAGKRSQVLFVGTEEAVQMDQVNVGLYKMLWIICWRLLVLGVYSLRISMLVCKYIFCIDWSKELMVLSSHALVLGSGASFNFFQKMTASKDSDLEGIRAKIREVFGEDPGDFDGTIGSATVRTSCGLVELSLLLWLETVSFLVLIPVNVGMAVLSLLLVAALAVPVLCCTRGPRCTLLESEEGFAQRLLALKMTPLTVQFILSWAKMNCLLSPPLIALILCAVGLVMIIPAASIVLAARVCSRCLQSLQQQPKGSSVCCAH